MIVNFSNSTPELIGLFGLTWQEKVAGVMQKALKGTKYQKLMSDFFSSGNKNTKIVNNCYNEYAALMSKGFLPSGFKVLPVNGKGGELNDSSIKLVSLINAKTNIDHAVIIEFLKALWILAKDGKIPFAKWNPKGHEETTALRKTFATEKTILDSKEDIKKYVNAGLIIAGLGVGGYLLSQIKSFKNLT